MSDEMVTLNDLRAWALILGVAGTGTFLLAYPNVVVDGVVDQGAAAAVGLGLAALLGGLFAGLAAVCKAWSNPSETSEWRPKTEWEAERGPLAAQAPLWIHRQGPHRAQQWAQEQRRRRGVGDRR